eukprot:9366905-Pyramimonas_sp.AAC.1
MRHAAQFTIIFLGWLVGPMKVVDTPAETPLDAPNKKVPGNALEAIRASVDPNTPLKHPGYK